MVPVTVDNFERAETDMYFASLVRRGPGVGRFEHMRELRSVELPGVRPNRDTLLALNETLPDLRRAAGRRGEVDPVRHLIVTASGWGANPDEDAVYLNVTPCENDGCTAYRLGVPRDVPVDGFWSVGVYDADGLFRKKDMDAYALNNVTAAKDPDGSGHRHLRGGQP